MTSKIINLQNELKRKIGEDKMTVGLPKNATEKIQQERIYQSRKKS